MSTNVPTFSLSKCFASTTGMVTVGDLGLAYLNIAVLSGNTVVWNMNKTSFSVFPKAIQVMKNLG